MGYIPIRTKNGVFLIKIGKFGLLEIKFPGSTKIKKNAVPGKNNFYLKTAKFLDGYFKNSSKKISEDLIDWTPYTEFQRKVYKTLLKVPAGDVISYSKLAKLAGFNNASRAVGSAMKKNKIPIIIPCHRVIRSDGSLGYYSGGIKWKRALLKHEGAGEKCGFRHGLPFMV